MKNFSRITKSFGRIMKSLRVEKGVTLEQMAEDLKTTKATLSRYENDVNQPKLDFLNEIADYLNTSTDYLLGRTNERFLVPKNPLPPELQELINSNDVEYIRAMKKAKQQGLSPQAIKAIIDIHADISRNSKK